MLSRKIKIIFMILGPLFILLALSGILPSILSFVIMCFGVAQVMMVVFKGGG